MNGEFRLVELGSGSSHKTRILLSILEKLQKQIQTLTNVEVERISKLLDALPVDAAMDMNEELLQQRFMHNILLIVDRTVAPTMSVLKTDSPFSTSDDL